MVVLSNEAWKDVVGYEGLYQISNLGNIKSIYYGEKEKILKIRKDDKGYPQAHLSKNGEMKDFKVHRLVATAFIGDIPDGFVINHINGIKDDNRVENLEICTYSHNAKEAYRLGLNKPVWTGKFGKFHKCSKKINQLDLDGNIVNTFYGAREAERETKICNINITQCLKKQRKTAGGYKWSYAD